MLKRKAVSLVLATVLAAGAWTANVAAATSEKAATVLTNGVVYTVDGENWENNAAEAVAIGSDGTLLFVGSAKEAKAYIGKDTKVTDLQGQVVMPGFVDAHTHMPGTAKTELFEIYLYESFTKEQTLQDIKDFIEANPDLDVYWGNGFNMGLSGDPKGPRKEWLDEICADKPIIISSNDAHNVWMNSKALEMNRITKNTPNPAGGLIQKDPATGELWGVLTDAFDVGTMSQTFTPEQETQALYYFQDNMHGWGYTAMMAIAPHFVEPEIVKAMDDAGDLTMRLNMAGLADPKGDFEAQLEDAKKLKAMMDSDLVDVSTMKFFADGVIEGMTGYLLEPYDAAAGLDKDYTSSFYWDPEALKGYFDRSMKEGFQIHVHSIGDASTRLVLDAMAYAQAENKTIEPRNVITHLQLVDDADKPRFGELKIIAALQPFWHLKEPDWWSVVDLPALGEERAWLEYPVKSLKDNGALLTASGDHPVSPVNNPFYAMEAAVTRNLFSGEFYGVDDITDMDDTTWLLNPEERISVKDIVEAYTINGAYQLGREDKIGSLVAGKYADLIVLDKDIFKVNPVEIDGIQVVATYFNGQVVYSEAE